LDAYLAKLLVTNSQRTVKKPAFANQRLPTNLLAQKLPASQAETLAPGYFER